MGRPPVRAAHDQPSASRLTKQLFAEILERRVLHRLEQYGKIPKPDRGGQRGPGRVVVYDGVIACAQLAGLLRDQLGSGRVLVLSQELRLGRRLEQRHRVLGCQPAP